MKSEIVHLSVNTYTATCTECNMLRIGLKLTNKFCQPIDLQANAAWRRSEETQQRRDAWGTVWNIGWSDQGTVKTEISVGNLQ